MGGWGGDTFGDTASGGVSQSRFQNRIVLSAPHVTNDVSGNIAAVSTVPAAAAAAVVKAGATAAAVAVGATAAVKVGAAALLEPRAGKTARPVMPAAW